MSTGRCLPRGRLPKRVRLPYASDASSQKPANCEEVLQNWREKPAITARNLANGRCNTSPMPDVQGRFFGQLGATYRLKSVT